ncbi:NAD(P)H-hydrate dehydratase [Desulfobulbus oligotrophicus]|uniref:Bifunctional NAD(P)H-hydrate repair enzyme n=1 Tax=Desulfobulbus oligotrophicus TaxID=1909699 RepID=A0A7T6ARR4_9BACT|nr:NAD(P)H-hydrate dehydratase [Desulfobulbus oligotrophicus]QQG66787.1 NAD(P)H-hydrate dehydratase [Desulfobulbus oligotrophicus]
MQLASATQMRELDRQTIEEIGIPGMVLMENAGRGTADSMQQFFGPVNGKTVCIFAGPGNNGGDGLVIARTVHGQGAVPFVFFATDPEQLTGDAGHNFSILKRLRIPYQVLDYKEKMLTLVDTILTLNRMHPVHCLVDALFGTGLERPISGPFLELVKGINILHDHHHMPVVSADIPSGLHSDSGTVLGEAVHADLTVTYGLPKPGLLHHGGPHVGRLVRVDIGLPTKIISQMQLKGSILDSDITAALRPRQIGAHKGSHGHLLILAGSTGKTGAALLAGQGALRSGAGLVTFAVPGNLNPIFETGLAEAMSVPLYGSTDIFSITDYEHILALSQGKDGIILGPGIGTDIGTGQLVLRLYTESPLPMVVDADALNILAAHPQQVRQPAGPRILTPHPGEMSRLLGTSIEQVQADRLAAALWLQTDSHNDLPPMITVLKGAGTVITSTDGYWTINTTGNPGMGAGGMGDVLAGIIGGLLVQGHTPWQAACLGVYLHGLAADHLACKQPFGYTASDVALALPQRIGTLITASDKEILCSPPKIS